MRPLMLIGLAVILAGFAELALEHLILGAPQSLIDAGSIKVLSRSDRFFPTSTLIGVFAILAGAAMVYSARPRRRTERPR